MGKPHKHAELIKAWANGAEIEFYEEFSREWVNTRNPGWYEDYEYRIKKSVVKYKCFLFKPIDSNIQMMVGTVTETFNYNPTNLSSFLRWIHDDWQEVEI